ncbi:MAG: mannose-1-phosphate guanylyltransferase [Clostridia bacterium]|nr:mannose-1-phosphate guanylyltransferase [Clostridia bacterium]
MKTYGVIMAGGGGTRFWPLSRKQTPKQLLNLSGHDFMVNEAIERLARVADFKDIFIVTNSSQKAAMLDIVDKRILIDHILSEPAARNTSACIGYAAMEILKKYGDGIMVITPSDAYIKNADNFVEVLEIAIGAAESTGKLITIGIQPTFPATGYGYIKYSNVSAKTKPVTKFVEKPDEKTAIKYLTSGNYVWNSGIFVWKASVILEKFKKLLPEVYLYLEKISKAFGQSDETLQIEKLYPLIPAISVDYGIMEKSDDILVVPGDFGWNDVGSWDMFNVLHKEDIDGNIKIGDALTVNSKNSIIYSSGKLIATIGVENLIVVETADAIMVCAKDKAQDVKKIVEELKARGREELL